MKSKMPRIQTPLQLNVGPALMQNFMSGASLYAAVCWPPDTELAKFQEATRALGAGVLLRTLQDEPGRHNELGDQFPDLMAVSLQQRRWVSRAMKTRLRHRMAAARMSLGFLEEGFTKKPARLPEGMSEMSLASLSTLVRSDAGVEDPRNVETLWRESQSVIHLAAALLVVSRWRYPEGPDARPDIDDPVFNRCVIQLAAMHEEIVEADPRFGKRRDRLVKLRWIE